MSVPSRQQISAQLEAVLQRDREARCVAIRSPSAAAWPPSLAVGSHRFDLAWCESALAVRLKLAEFDARRDSSAEGGGAASPDAGLVVLTPLGEAELGDDVMARVARSRVFAVERWDTVRQVFGAVGIDARLARLGWVADALVELAPPGGYDPVPNGFLDLYTARHRVQQGLLGLDDARPDAVSLLRWTVTPGALQRWTALGAGIRDDLAAWLVEGVGPVGPRLLQCIAAGHGEDAIALGIVCGVVFADTAGPAPELAAAAVRLERFVGGQPVSRLEGLDWAGAANRALPLLDADLQRRVLARADALTVSLHLQAHQGLSDLLPGGFEARLAAFAVALSAWLVHWRTAPTAAGRTDALADAAARVTEAAHSVAAHRQAAVQHARSERVAMASRLVRWLLQAGPQTPLPGVALLACANAYAMDGAFADWARLKLLGGDASTALTQAQAALVDAVKARREAFNADFARAVQAEGVQPMAPAGTLLPVEAVLDTVVAPLARRVPVLMIVVDGLSLPIYQELARDLEQHGWQETVPVSDARAPVALAALPTVTEVSRASLLAGRLANGASSFEKGAFASHPALLAVSRARTKPVLFHKGELGDALGLAPPVRAAIADPALNVVGVVFNAVDDQLGGSDQLHLRWTLEDLRLLGPLLHEARSASRVLVITADHGHVLDDRSAVRAGSDGDRWRSPAGAVQPDEVQLGGARVISPTGGTSVVCAWSERLRYASKRNGYHGGVSPQEALVPLGVFAPVHVVIEGWKAAPPRMPEWWDASVVEAPAPVAPIRVVEPAPTITRRKADTRQQGLFAEEGHDARPDGTLEAGPTGVTWIDALLSSETYRAQRTLAARVAPRDEDMRALLAALEERGGKLNRTALAQRLSMPLLRVGGFVHAARRVLNVDQAAVLMLDDASGTVTLDRRLLELQFEVRS
jgi:hypothetical protein